MMLMMGNSVVSIYAITNFIAIFFTDASIFIGLKVYNLPLVVNVSDRIMTIANGSGSMIPLRILVISGIVPEARICYSRILRVGWPKMGVHGVAVSECNTGAIHPSVNPEITIMDSITKSIWAQGHSKLAVVSHISSSEEKKKAT